MKICKEAPMGQMHILLPNFIFGFKSCILLFLNVVLIFRRKKLAIGLTLFGAKMQKI
jgi:hypothetical protein